MHKTSAIGTVDQERLKLLEDQISDLKTAMLMQEAGIQQSISDFNQKQEIKQNSLVKQATIKKEKIDVNRKFEKQLTLKIDQTGEKLDQLEKSKSMREASFIESIEQLLTLNDKNQSVIDKVKER